MENITKLLKMAFAAIIFCIGIACLFYEMKTYHTSLAGVRELYKEDKVAYMEYNSKDIMTVNYSELIAILMQPLEINIMVNDKLIDKESHTADQLASYGILNTVYQKTYHYDAEGNVDLVIYTGMN